ncbi:glycosyltransferase family 2 protein [Sphingomonas sp. LR60]|uniref:glycosyltransferase family 2 protein n=1 Tax=Sphingomonas sp. LR60 TaxID=3050233 RepID=UPI002FE24168
MKWSFVIPYFNEADYLPATLESLAAQTFRPFRLILVDNGSTDASAALARQVGAMLPDIDVVHLREPRPGKIHALEHGLAAVATPYIAFGDADTIYPPHYLATADAAFAPGVVAVMGTDVPGDDAAAALRKRRHVRYASRLWPRQTHTGGYGQTFRTDALRAAGGYGERWWRYVLEDHEIMQRVGKQGRVVYPFDLWCVPSNRRADRSAVNWTLAERLLYHFTPAAAKDWYFYRFLGPRLAARRMDNLNLRDKTWL